MASSSRREAAVDDPGLFSWVLAVLFWGECLVAVVAALTASGGGQRAFFWGYAGILAVVAVARSAPLAGWRGLTWTGLASVAVAHGLSAGLGLGARPGGGVEVAFYVLAVVGCGVALWREPRLPPDRTLPAGLRSLEVLGRSAGLLFAAGLLLLLVDTGLRLPFSGH